jgi:glutamine synthetase adenylyltransferase
VSPRPPRCGGEAMGNNHSAGPGMISCPLGPQSPAQCDQTVIQEMASVLRSQAVDLRDERAVMRALVAARFRSGDVAALSDAAAAAAKQSLTRRLSEIAIAVALVAVVFFSASAVEACELSAATKAEISRIGMAVTLLVLVGGVAFTQRGRP